MPHRAGGDPHLDQVHQVGVGLCVQASGVVLLRVLDSGVDVHALGEPGVDDAGVGPQLEVVAAATAPAKSGWTPSWASMALTPT